MANYDIYYDITLTDVNGDSATTHVKSVNADTAALAGMSTTATAVANVIGACSNAKVTAIGLHTTFTKAQISAGTAPPPANATYPSVTDGARLQFANSAGDRRAVTVPAPLLADFITGSNTVNASNTNVAALIAELEALNDPQGGTNLYEGGVKTGRHARRRASRKTL